MIDPITALAVNLEKNKGIYALLLGSGVSRSSDIPTGYEITLSLIKRIAAASGEECMPTPELWFENKFGVTPEYSVLLEKLARTPAERRSLLSSYFVASPADREKGAKQPSSAHRAIARLVEKGYIKVIITTNFDHLLENALQEIGIEHVVLSTDDDIKGCVPIRHQNCVILKVNGDYLDNRIRNTQSELSKYSKLVTTALDEILDEYGLIICGWSGDWDIALYNAIKRTSNNRFTLYWTLKSKPTELAKLLINKKRAELIQISDADSFFTGLAEKITSLEQVNAPSPLDAKIIIADFKRFISDQKYKPSLHDLFMSQSVFLFEQLSENKFPYRFIHGQNSEFQYQERITYYENATDVMMQLVAYGCYFGGNSCSDLIMKSLEHLSHPSHANGYTKEFYNLRFYPIILLFYVSGISSIHANQYQLYAQLLSKTYFQFDERRKELIWLMDSRYHPSAEAIEALDKTGHKNVQFGRHLFKIIRPIFKDLIPNDKIFKRTYYRFEYISSLVFADYWNKRNGELSGPLTFSLVDSVYDSDQNIMKIIDAEIAGNWTTWPFITCGLFQNNIDIFKDIKSKYDKLILPYLSRINM